MNSPPASHILKFREHGNGMTEPEHDDLTGLRNARYANRVLRELLLRATASKEQPVTLTLVDVDGFVTLNRSYGYERGDEFLRELAHVLETECRGDETLCRYAGDEFWIISPAKSREDANRRAERVRNAVKTLALSSEPDELGAVTVTVALAFWPADGVSPDALTRAADRALGSGKSRGGDCVVTPASDSM